VGLVKVRVLGAPGTGFGVGAGKGDVYAGDVVELDEATARVKSQQGVAELVAGELPKLEPRVDPENTLHKPEDEKPATRKRA
jgi:hypothetical protein